MGRFIDLTGQKFGRLTVIERDIERDNIRKAEGKKPKTYWFCKCECGNITSVESVSLRSGATTSCGCYGKEQRLKAQTKHGLSGTRIKRIYYNMLSRCYNPKTPKFKNHGGREIKVCDEWLGENGFINFVNWAMSNGYDEDLTLDRIDNDGNYSPDNCRWANEEIQHKNRRITLYIEYNGEKKTVQEWSKELGIPENTIYTRYFKGIYTTEEILYKGKLKRNLKNKGE